MQLIKKTAPITDRIKQMAEYKPFFDAIAMILQELKSQQAVRMKVILLPKSIDMTAKSNLGITVQTWWDHNFGNEYGIEVKWF